MDKFKWKAQDSKYKREIINKPKRNLTNKCR